jgi:hypothetical protein
MTHNEAVVSKINQFVCDQETARENKMERMQTKIRQAAAKRGSQLLLVRQTAEKMRKHRISDTTPVSFDIKVERTN